MAQNERRADDMADRVDDLLQRSIELVLTTDAMGADLADAQHATEEVRQAVSTIERRLPEIHRAALRSHPPDFDRLYGAVVAVGVSIDGADPTQQYGTGFCVDGATGLLITCHHVLLGLDAVTMHSVPDSSGPTRTYCLGCLRDLNGDGFDWRYEAEVLAVSVRPGVASVATAHGGHAWLDLAVLRVTRRRDGAPVAYPLPQLQRANSDADAMTTAQPLWVLGYGQQSSSFARTRHTCQGGYAGRRPHGGSSWLMTTADVLGGHSGGPVVDQHGRVVGWCLLSLTDRINNYPQLRETNGGLHALRPINEALPLLSRLLPAAAPAAAAAAPAAAP